MLLVLTVCWQDQDDIASRQCRIQLLISDFFMNKLMFPVSEAYYYAYFNSDFLKYMKQLMSPR